MYEYINICEDMIESNIILEKVEEKKLENYYKGGV